MLLYTEFLFYQNLKIWPKKNFSRLFICLAMTDLSLSLRNHCLLLTRLWDSKNNPSFITCKQFGNSTIVTILYILQNISRVTFCSYVKRRITTEHNLFLVLTPDTFSNCFTISLTSCLIRLSTTATLALIEAVLESEALKAALDILLICSQNVQSCLWLLTYLTEITLDDFKELIFHINTVNQLF